MNSVYRNCFWLLGVVTILGANSAPADVAVQYHCAGVAQLADDTNLTSFQQVLALPTTTNIVDIALARLANLVTNNLGLGNDPSSGSLLEPLLGDAMQTESVGSFGGGSGNALSFILALHLEAQRAPSWQDALTKIFGHEGEKFATQEFGGWRWSQGGSNFLWLIPARDWLLIGRGDDFAALQTEYLGQIKAQGRPVPALEGHWLEADMSSSQLGGWFRLLQPASLRIAVATNGDGLEISARLLEKEAILWKSDPWLIPKEMTRGRIISFTAGQNVAAFLNVSPAYARLPGNPLTNQFYVWALDQLPLLNYMAWPVADASNVLRRLSTEAPVALNPDLKRFNGTELVWKSDMKKLFWLNMTMFAPSLQTEQNRDGQFLLLSSFPLAETEPPPDSILSQIQGRTNLVYYDWEITGRRLGEWQILSKMISNRSFAPNKDAANKANTEHAWLGGLAQLAGNTVTEITRVAPNEMAVARNGPIGLTAVELALLTDWLCDVNSGPIHPQPTPIAKKMPAPLPRHP